jgi:hypothetical protein
MYEVKGKYWIVRDGEKQPPAPTLHFHTAMGMLRWALNNGMMRRAAWGNSALKPDEMERVSIPYAGSGDWQGDYYFTPDQVAAMGRALSRYRAHLHYRREIEPEWREVERVRYADNSTESHQQDKYGRTRTVMLVAPHGDVCF